ncbi:Inositol-1,4,5-trisphosphate 5-phosphatase 1 [Emydomyces testavorans]|uniref:Inositol-1,4,5-trisphosphate 5-phosphatase 1 n=1 Tax=Emydomyces testavorans TaxID=2070801 RepID=A0AAF0DM12_9EURO|nr:Inositol-1,4,5-trisphosphate 5-phosphatase 1 [Emydomyces testavorans]
MVAGLTFQYYSEGPITFPPTYRYDNGTDVYDTSEKRRIPAWCDRILWKGENLRQLEYNTAPLKFSDHRPVYAVFKCTIRTVDEELKARLSRELYEKYKTAIEATNSNSRSEHTEEGGSVHGGSIASGLPPASSDRRLPVRSSVSLTVGPVTSFGTNSNPFSAVAERDWPHKTHHDGNSKPPHRAKSESPFQKHLAYRDDIESSGNDSLLDVETPAESETISLPQLIETSEKPKKMAPPVPRKPTALSSSQGPRPPAGIRPQHITTATKSPGRPEKVEVGTNHSFPQVKKGMAETLQYQNRSVLPSIKPIPSNRKPDREGQSGQQLSAAAGRGPSSIELLDSEVDTGMSQWKPLQPGR